MPLLPRFDWSDLVLPEEKMDQLRGVEARVRHRQLVHRQWGFGEKLSRGKGLNVLFTGPSGTGKTMAAEVLAGALGLTLHQIDLSTVISKYIGETEQHLSAIFHEAESSQTLLFFDEAEALFGKRTEVKDAHDRYANIEVNYLLQRIEQYEGIVVLVSPLTKLDRNSGPGYAVGVPFCTEGDSLCVVVSRACCPLPLPTKTVCTQPLIVTACPGIKCGGPEFCWLSLPVSASVMSPLKWDAA